MNNPIIQTDLADILTEIRNDQKKLLEKVNQLEIGQTAINGHLTNLDSKLSGKIEALDVKLSGQIKSVDEKLSGKIDVLDRKIVGQKDVAAKTSARLEKRIGNQEFSNRIGLRRRTL